ncbi:MAG: copper resistance protein CopC [Austwickia sp.]|nr:copper resistance protein CopC [Austwickia sp.]
MPASARRTGLFPLLAVLAFCATLLIALTGAPAASAHSALVSSTPADGATVPTLPDTASLTFNEDISPDFAQIVVQGSGEPRQATPTVKGPVVSAPLPADIGAGRVVVRYRVVSKDGHPISGEIAFTVGAAGGTPGAAGATTSGAGTETGSTTAASPAATATSPRAGQAANVSRDSDNIVAYVLTGFVAVAMLAIGLMLWRWEKQRSNRQP